MLVVRGIVLIIPIAAAALPVANWDKVQVGEEALECVGLVNT